jgi:MSHA biogenesis protein MshK
VRSASLAAAAVLLLGSPARAGDVLPDPTRPEIAPPSAASPATAAERFELRAVLIGGARRVAVINGRAVQVGDSVDGAEVLAIDAGRVRIRTPDGERALALAPAVRVEPAEREDP